MKWQPDKFKEPNPFGPTSLWGGKKYLALWQNSSQAAHVSFQPPLGEESGRRRAGEDHHRHQPNSSKTLPTTKPAACQSRALGSVSSGNTVQATKSIESDVPEK